MATSSAMSTSNQYIKYKITVTQNSQSVTDNTSNVTVSVKVYRTNTGFTTYGAGTCYCKINGTTYSSSITASHKFTYNSNTQVFSKTLNIPHNTDGTKTLTCSAWIDHARFDSSEQSYSQTLTTIPRTSVLGTISNFTLGNSINIPITKYSSSFTDTLTISVGGSTVKTISGITNGYDVTFTSSELSTIYSKLSGSTSGTFTFKLTTKSGSTTIGTSSKTTTGSIPNGTLGTISNFTLGNNVSIPISNYHSSLTYNLAISLSNTTIKTVNGVTNGSSISFTTSELNTIYGKLPSATSGSFTFKITTKNGSATVGTSSKTATGTIPTSVKPSISSVTISEGNTSVVPSSWGVYVKNKSKLNFVTSASGGTGSSVSSVKIVINGSTYTGTSITTNVINVSGSLTATIEVTDKRGRMTSTTKDVSIADYNDPYLTTLKAFRCDVNGNESDKGTYIRINLNGGIYSVNGKNTPSYVVQYKKTSENEYQTYTFDVTEETIDSYVVLSDIDSSSSYNVRAIISDYFTSLSINSSPILSVYRTVNFKAGGRSIGIGKFAEEDDLVDVGLPTKFNEPVYGNVMGLSYLPPIPENGDLNDYLTPGAYGIHANVIAETISNMPLGIAGRLEVTNGLGGNDDVEGWLYLRQRFIPYKVKGATYERYIAKDGSGNWKFDNWITTTLPQTILYENSSGSNGTITLSESAAKYSYLEIFFTDNKKVICNSIKVDSPNGKTTSLFLAGGWINGSTTTTDIRTRAVLISENSIATSGTTTFLSLTSNISIHNTTNYIYITKVIGYNYLGQ